MTDRDYFAAAALTGLLCNGDFSMECIPLHAFSMADAMLRERCRAGADCPVPDNAPNLDAAPVSEHEWKSAYENMQRASLRLYAKIRDIADDVCGIGSGVTVSTHHAPEWLDAIASECHRVRIELEQLRAKTNHDAAPARANAESVAPQPTAGDRAGNPPSHSGTGDTPKPISGCVSDRSKPINGPDPDSRVWETPVHTPATHATHVEGSERRECTEPVAWGVASHKGLLYATAISRIDAVDMQSDYACDTEVVPLYRQAPDFAPPPPDNAAKAPDNAEPVAWAVCTPGDGDWSPCFLHEPHAQRHASAILGSKNIVPLYRSPTLTDAEREAVERAVAHGETVDAAWRYALRGLLERMK